MIEFEKMNYEWNESLTSYEWDNFLSKLHGHPLQSAKWGESKKISCRINDHRWIAFKDGSPVFIVRFEERRLFRFLKIAWVPKGPVAVDKHDESIFVKEFLHRLKKRGFFLCVTNPWEKIEFTNKINSVFYTIWLDLTIKKEKLWANLHKQCRYDIKRAKKLGVIIEKSDSHEDLNSFYKICESISKTKGFNLGASLQSMSHLLFSSDHDQVKSHLFVARHEGNLCGGAFLMRCGESVHYLWGAVDRNFAHLCIGEALQWEIIEWALSKNYKKYDLEGISTLDSGVDKFKKKLGGTIIAYPGIQIYPLHIGRHIVLFLTKIYLLLQPKISKHKKYFLLDRLFLWNKIRKKYFSKA